MIDRDKLIDALTNSLVGSEWIPPGWRLSFLVVEIEDRGTRSAGPGYVRLFASMVETSDPIRSIPIYVPVEYLLIEGRRLSDD